MKSIPTPGFWRTVQTATALKKAKAASVEVIRLRKLGERERALAVEDEALAIYRQMVESHPEYQFLLASQLDERACALSELGRHEQALAASSEAVAIIRPLAKERPKYVVWLLCSHSLALSDLGRSEEALAASDEAAVAGRALVEAQTEARDPSVCHALASLADALDLRSRALRDLGRSEEAVAAQDEAVALSFESEAVGQWQADQERHSK